MARIRTIKPEFFRHEILQEIEQQLPQLRPMLVFAGLWSQCDRNGVFEWKPRQLKLDILPYIEFEMEQTLAVLVSHGFIEKYEADGKIYGFVPGFKKHQVILGKEYYASGKHPQKGSENGQKRGGEIPENFPGNSREFIGNLSGNDGELRNNGIMDNIGNNGIVESSAPAHETPPLPSPIPEKIEKTENAAETPQPDIQHPAPLPPPPPTPGYVPPPPPGSDPTEYLLAWGEANQDVLRAWAKEQGAIQAVPTFSAEIRKFCAHYLMKTKNLSTTERLKQTPLEFFRANFPLWLGKCAEYAKTQASGRKSNSGQMVKNGGHSYPISADAVREIIKNRFGGMADTFSTQQIDRLATAQNEAAFSEWIEKMYQSNKTRGAPTQRSGLVGMNGAPA